MLKYIATNQKLLSVTFIDRKKAELLVFKETLESLVDISYPSLRLARDRSTNNTVAIRDFAKSLNWHWK